MKTPRVRAVLPRTADLSTGELVRTAAALGPAWFGELVRREHADRVERSR